MHRLFVAIRPPAPVRRLLLAAMGGINGARWQTDEQLHLTLRFVGEVDRHLAQDVHAALGGIHTAPFAIALRGLGAFEKRGRPETLWAGVAPPEPVRALHRKVDQALTRVGVEPDRRAYHPHITLARLNRSAGPAENFLAGAAGLTSDPFMVGSFALHESHLTPEGPVYATIERYGLG